MISSKAPAKVTLKALDTTLAAGWAKRRDAIYSGDNNLKAQQSDVVPIGELMRVSSNGIVSSQLIRCQVWVGRIQKSKTFGENIDRPDLSKVSMDNKNGADSITQAQADVLTKLAVRFRDLKDTEFHRPMVNA